MPVDHVEYDSDAALVRCVHERLQSDRSAEIVLRREVRERTIAPVELVLHRCDRHQRQAIHGEASEIVEAIDDAAEGAVELRDVELIDVQIVERGRTVGAVSKRERRRGAQSEHAEQARTVLGHEWIEEHPCDDLANAPQFEAIEIWPLVPRCDPAGAATVARSTVRLYNPSA